MVLSRCKVYKRSLKLALFSRKQNMENYKSMMCENGMEEVASYNR